MAFKTESLGRLIRTMYHNSEVQDLGIDSLQRPSDRPKEPSAVHAQALEIEI